MTAVRTSGGSGVAGMVPPPGTKMVPVKLVTVGSAENNMRLVRVSPVKSHVTEVSVGSTVVMQRDVVVKPTPSTVMQVRVLNHPLLYPTLTHFWPPQTCIFA